MKLSWVHPSIRDLVIDRLSEKPGLRAEFLRTADLPGIRIALSRAGGERGERLLPLLQTQSDVDALLKRIREFVDTPAAAQALLDQVEDAATLLDVGPELVIGSFPSLVRDCLVVVLDAWERAGEPVSPGMLERFGKVSVVTPPLTPFPDLGPTWAWSVRSLRAKDGSDIDSLLDAAASWVSLVRVARQYEPRFLRVVDFPSAYQTMLGVVKASVADELDELPAWSTDDDPDEWPDEAPYWEWARTAVEVLAEVERYDHEQDGDPPFSDRVANEVEKWEEFEATLEDLKNDAAGDHRDWSDYAPGDEADAFSVAEFFSDL